MKAAIYNRFWHSMGGGERHSGMIAQVLTSEGIAVDLIGHSEVDRDELSARLGLDLRGCSMRIVPDRGDEDLARLSADYDLFVNAMYMSRLQPRSTHSAYLCFFPTPFDHDLPRWRKAAIRTVGPYLRPTDHIVFQFGTGWFPPEGGRRRRWTWTNGDAIITLDPGPERVFEADFARVGRPDAVEMTLTDDAGTEIDRFEVTAQFQRRRIVLPASDDGMELHLRSDTFVPGDGDSRSLGVAVSRMRLGGGAVGLRGQVALRFPWLRRDPGDLSFLDSYDVVLANSRYTQGWIERLWHTESDILFPPIDVTGINAAERREKAILTVGRFFAPGLGHAKRQLEMVGFFGDMVRRGGLDGWTMHVVGGCEDSQLSYLEQVRQAGAGLPVEIHANAPRPLVRELMSTSSIFWSATGYGEDEHRAPWAQEHFGMTTAEAMAGGCVPVVIDRAGQREIVRDGVDGFRWNTPEELSARTLELAGDQELWQRMSASTTIRAQEYSDGAFAERWWEIAKRRELLDTD